MRTFCSSRYRRVLSVLALGLALTACSDAEPTREFAPLPGDPLSNDAGRLRDGLGRHVILRGVNARVRGLFDVTFDDGRTALEPIPPLTAEDCRFMGEDMGFNLLRLPVNWSGIEPERGRYDEAYIDGILNTARGCDAHGVRTLVDLHQDAYSKHIGEDGAPLWAIVPPPEMLLEGPLHDLEQRRTSAQVLEAFASLFANDDGLSDAYAAMAAHLAARIDGQPGVIGLELMNEPVLPPGDEARLDEFHARVGAAIHAAAPRVTQFFEPNSLRNFSDKARVRTPYPLTDAVYSPHLYTGVFDNSWAIGDEPDIAASLDAMVDEAADHGTPLFVGEFGNDPKTVTGTAWLDAALAEMDRVQASWAFWVYEEWSQGSWGLFDAVTEPSPGRVALREALSVRLARPYPAAIDGTIAAWTYDPDTRALTVTIAAAGDGQHVLALPERTYPTGAVVRCDGVAATAAVKNGRALVACPGRELSVRPR